MNYLIFLYRRAHCMINGHSHPAFNCFHCGASSPWEFIRDENGDAVIGIDGHAKMRWIGWGWKAPR